MSHRRRYAVTTTRETVVDLLGLDTLNPRSVIYQLTEIRDHTAVLPGAEISGQLSELSRAVLRTHTALAVRTPETLTPTMLRALRSRITALSDLLGTRYMN